MSNDKMRQEFEAKFPLPAGVAWKDSIGMYEVVDVWKLDKPITIGMYNWLWEGWQASRAAIVVELPEAQDFDGYYNPGHGFEKGDVVAAIEAAGLKVKP